MSENTSIAKLARIRSKPSQAGLLRDALLKLEAETRCEPGCLEFSFFQALSDGASFVLLERFQSETALQRHMQAAYTQHFFALGWVEDVVVCDL